MSDRNTTPTTVWDALRRLLRCNKMQLAARLGVSRQTLMTWEKATERGEPIEGSARRAAAELLTATLRASGQADDLLRPRTSSAPAKDGPTAL